MTTLYIVNGCTGQYSGETQWPVVAFFTLEKAEERVRLATLRASALEHWICDTCDDTWRWCQCGVKPVNAYDPHMKMDDGVTYFITAVELEDA